MRFFGGGIYNMVVAFIGSTLRSHIEAVNPKLLLHVMPKKHFLCWTLPFNFLDDQPFLKKLNDPI